MLRSGTNTTASGALIAWPFRRERASGPSPAQPERPKAPSSRFAQAARRCNYKVVKPGWYVLSGTRGGEILYEKGLHFTNSARLRISYPAAAKSAFDPLAARIANSFGEYLVVTAKAGVMVEEDGEAGLLFLDDVPDDSINQLTTCAIDAGKRQQFAGIKEGQPITVGGQPRMVNVRAQTAENAGVDHRQLDHCALRSGRP
jgi:hypothetical protein